MDAEAFGEALRRAITEVTREVGGGRGAELVGRATERLNALGVAPPVQGVVLWLSEPMAFTAPGRYVYVSRQLLSRGLTEAGVAFVVAHEIAHHVLGHTDEVGALFARGEICHHSPEREIDADREAVSLCAQAGYGQDGVREWLALVAVGGEPLPPPLDRIAAALGQSATSLTVRREALLGLTVPRPRTTPAPKGSTATGMVVACGRCFVRFPPGQPCPRCGGSQLADLRDPVARRRFLKVHLGEEGKVKGIAERVVGGVAAATGAALSGYLLATGAGAVAVLAALGLLGVPAGQLLRWTREDARKPPRNPTVELRPLAVAPPRDEGEEIRVTGTVVVRRAVRALLSERSCAAWRLTGMGPSGAVDDAAVGSFDVFEDGKVVARVDAEHAFLNLGAVRAPLTLRALEGAVADVLRARGRVPDHASAALAESVLVEGDRVVVSGPARNEIVSDGMRGADEILVFREWPLVRLTT